MVQSSPLMGHILQAFLRAVMFFFGDPDYPPATFCFGENGGIYQQVCCYLSLWSFLGVSSSQPAFGYAFATSRGFDTLARKTASSKDAAFQQHAHLAGAYGHLRRRPGPSPWGLRLEKPIRSWGLPGVRWVDMKVMGTVPKQRWRQETLLVG